METLTGRTYALLYQAKSRGRNRVCSKAIEVRPQVPSHHEQSSSKTCIATAGNRHRLSVTILFSLVCRQSNWRPAIPLLLKPLIKYQPFYTGITYPNGTHLPHSNQKNHEEFQIIEKETTYVPNLPIDKNSSATPPPSQTGMWRHENPCGMALLQLCLHAPNRPAVQCPVQTLLRLGAADKAMAHLWGC